MQLSDKKYKMFLKLDLYSVRAVKQTHIYPYTAFFEPVRLQ